MQPEQSPSKSGWYPAVLCWEPEEGFFPTGAFWNGSAWENASALCEWVDERFETEGEAQARAYDLGLGF